ncbi:hypothetical protein OE749_01500 [Aestuariibacter sp. AA17]|uniref:Uncharacterized protein n=1 Tax=Fluctibacter corallii TaxID=2984329 RepID=A0ABT3A3V3_9ALTE|nr:hypothetical protein [Aestuariibacter sp. AA17]MCV2883371.1 hypothetical protein [Aestuariibacter sp. AA17]
MVVHTDDSKRQFHFRTRHGEISMEVHGNIVVGRFSGAISSNLTSKLASAITDLLAPLQGTPWGYLSISNLAEGATPDAEQGLIDALMVGFKMGVVCSAYIIHSPVAVAQMDRVRKACGATDDIRDHLFSDEKSAREYLNEKIRAYENAQRQTG